MKSVPQLRYLFTADDPRAYRTVQRYRKEAQSVTFQELADRLQPNGKECLHHHVGLVDDIDLAPLMDEVYRHSSHPNVPIRMKATLYVYELLRHILGKRPVAETESYLIPFTGRQSVLFGDCAIDGITMLRLSAPNVRPLPLPSPVCVLKVLLTRAPGYGEWGPTQADIGLYEARSLRDVPTRSDIASLIARDFDPLPASIPMGRDTVIRIPYTANGTFDLVLSAPSTGDGSRRYRAALMSETGVRSRVAFDVTSASPADIVADAALTIVDDLREQGEDALIPIFTGAIRDACEERHAHRIAEESIVQD